MPIGKKYPISARLYRWFKKNERINRKLEINRRRDLYRFANRPS
jgi:hypothetical protein